MNIKCGCKVNLYLKILNKRDDGYHNLDTLFYPSPIPFDILEIEEMENENTDSSTTPTQNINVQCETKGIDPKDNTLTKAYTLYKNATGFSPKIHVNLIKGIPHGAGLGGGSSDAAALLNYLQGKNPCPLSPENLITLAAKIGADVPFFLINTPCKAHGIGEILKPVTLKLNDLYLLLITPEIQINTKWAFLKLDEEKKDLTVFQALDKNQRSYFLKDFFWENDFERPVFLEYPHLREIKTELIKQGASVALLSGSGSSIFGLFRSLETARNAAKILKEMFHLGSSTKVYDPIKMK